jgi:hypothetical protein
MYSVIIPIVSIHIYAFTIATEDRQPTALMMKPHKRFFTKLHRS